MKLFKRIVFSLIIASLAISMCIYFFILHYASSAKPVKSDVIIVLGCQIRDRVPSLSLEYRLNKALEIYKKNYASNIIVSGGQGKDEVTSESNVMKEWLVKHGIDSNKIIEEHNSTSTFENLKYSKEVMNKNGYKSAIIISNDFHMFRSLKLAKRLNISASGAPAPSVGYLKPYYHFREIISVVKSFVFDR